MLLIIRKIIAEWRSVNFLNLLFVTLVFLSLCFFSVFNCFFLLLDYIFYPGFRNVEIKRPVFIIGHPRSGTTFLHRLFLQTNEMASFKSWHLLFPSLTLRFFLRPLMDYLIRNNMDELIPEEAGTHMTLDKEDEEELLFIHNLDTQFLTLTALGILDDDYRDLRFHDLQPRCKRIRSASFLKSCFQRQIYYTGRRQIFAQMHYSTHRIKTLMEVFPDARFIYIDRTPHETLPSVFSLIYYSLTKERFFDKLSPSEFRRFFEYRYQASRDLYKYFHDIWNKGKIDKDRVLIVPYALIREDLMAVYKKIVAFTGVKTSARLERAVEMQVKKQGEYKRKHTVKKLEEFGIDEKRVKDDFVFYFQNSTGGQTRDLALS